ncbi:MAG: hypothetical protein Q9170_001133 [Blastenia crenularia]
MHPFINSPNGTTCATPIIKEVGRVHEGIAMNGMTHIHQSDDFVLISDSLVGGVWKVHIKTGKHELVIKDASMDGPANETDFSAYGINGLRVKNNVLFYCNSGAQTFWKMPLHANATTAGPASLITSDIACDDFAIDDHDNAYVASPRNALIRLDTRTGAQLVVAGTFNKSSSDILSATSARFGIGKWDRGSVYLTTNGGAFVGAPKGSQGISRVDLGLWEH